MKILMTTDTLGGVWTYCMELCHILQEYGVEIHLASMGALPSAKQREEVDALQNVKIYPSDFKLEWMQDCEEDLVKARKWIVELGREIDPDLIHLNNYMPLDFDNKPVITVIHSCVATWWQAVKGEPAPAEWKSYRQLVKDSLENSSLVVGPTAAMLRQAVKTYGISTPTKVIYNGRDIKFSASARKQNFIFAMGRVWDEAKNLQILSNIADELSWPVYIAGDNENPSNGEKAETENVHFLGNLSFEEIKKWLSKASVFVSPSLYEPFGLAILEAAKAKCALVLSDIESLEELWLGAAVFFDPKEPKELKKQLQPLIENEMVRDYMAQQAAERAEYYSLQKMGKNYMESYEQLLQKETRKQKIKL